ncbi:MAG: hypothetical protein AAF587_41590 [Bacteroidota bacterium]
MSDLELINLWDEYLEKRDSDIFSKIRLYFRKAVWLIAYGEVCKAHGKIPNEEEKEMLKREASNIAVAVFQYLKTTRDKPARNFHDWIRKVTKNFCPNKSL